MSSSTSRIAADAEAAVREALKPEAAQSGAAIAGRGAPAHVPFVVLGSTVEAAAAKLINSATGRSHVKVFGSTAALLPYIEQENFVSFPGVRTTVAAIRLNDGITAILLGAAPGVATAPHVRIVDGTSNTVRSSFFAFDPLFTGGVFVG